MLMPECVDISQMRMVLEAQVRASAVLAELAQHPTESTPYDPAALAAPGRAGEAFLPPGLAFSLAAAVVGPPPALPVPAPAALGNSLAPLPAALPPPLPPALPPPLSGALPTGLPAPLSGPLPTALPAPMPAAPAALGNGGLPALPTALPAPLPPALPVPTALPAGLPATLPAALPTAPASASPTAASTLVSPAEPANLLATALANELALAGPPPPAFTAAVATAHQQAAVSLPGAAALQASAAQEAAIAAQIAHFAQVAIAAQAAQQPPQQPPREPPRQEPQRREPSGTSRNTLRAFLEELRSKDHRCIFVARRINQLGFRSRGLLERYFSRFGEVQQVMVAHSKVKSLRNSPLPRMRPGNLGLIVMFHPEDVQRVLAEGSEQTISGVQITIQVFDRQKMDQLEGIGRSSTGSSGVVTDESTASGSSGEALCFKDEDCRQSRSVPARTKPRATSAVKAPAVTAAPAAAAAPAPALAPAWAPATASAPTLAASVEVPAAPGAAPAAAPGARAPQIAQAVLSAANLSYNDALLFPPGLATPMPACPFIAPELERSLQQAAALRRLAEQAQQTLKCFEAQCTKNLEQTGGAVPSSAAPAQPQLPLPVGLLRAQALATAAQEVMDMGMLKEGSYAHATPSANATSPGVQSVPVQTRWQDARCQESFASAGPLQSSGRAGGGGAAAAGPTGGGSGGFGGQRQARRDREEGGDRAARGGARGGPPAPAAASSSSSSAGSGRAEQAREAREPREARPQELQSKKGGGTGGSKPAERQRGPQGAGSQQQIQQAGFKDTLVTHLSQLQHEDPARVVVVRGIGNLGFRSRKLLRQHFLAYGEVASIHITHSTTKVARDTDAPLRTRPGGLGLIVMKSAVAVDQILAASGPHKIAGHVIRVQGFQRPWSTVSNKDSARSTKEGEEAAEASGTGSPDSAAAAVATSAADDEIASSSSAGAGDGVASTTVDSGSYQSRSGRSGRDADVGSSEGSEGPSSSA